MCYVLHCKECGEEISAEQYDAYLGLCAPCFADEEDLHDAELFDDDGNPEAGQRRNIEREPYETWTDAKKRATRIEADLNDNDPDLPPDWDRPEGY